MSSCTADELEQANEMNNTMTTNTVESAREGDIDPPIPISRP
ncbi:MAG: hypothetical protein ABWZ56_06555 [Flavobacterium sp.]